MAGSYEPGEETGWDQTQNLVEDLGERHRRPPDPIVAEEEEHLVVARA